MNTRKDCKVAQCQDGRYTCEDCLAYPDKPKTIGKSKRQKALKNLREHIITLQVNKHCSKEVTERLIKAFNVSLTAEQIEAIREYSQVNFNHGIKVGKTYREFSK